MSAREYRYVWLKWQRESLRLIWTILYDKLAQAILDCKGDYNFLGDVEIPEGWQDDEQDAGAPDKNEQEETA